MAYRRLMLSLSFIFLLTGCLYPAEQRKENQVSGLEYVTVVQSAIDQYYDRTSILPIVNFTMDTPLYERYRIDFQKLLESPYLSMVPPNAFEGGGNSYYVLTNVEETPLVRLMDLVTSQEINDLQREVHQYMQRHSTTELPLSDSVGAGWYLIDFEALGKPTMQIRSVFTGSYLSLLMNQKGKVLVDYGPDLMRLIHDKNLSPQENVDLRTLLVEHSLFVPVKSAAYYWRNNEPTIAAG